MDPNKVQAITDLPDPKNKKEIQTLMGMVNYLGKYLENLSSITEPLRQLQKDEDFSWEECHIEAFQ